MRVVLDTNVFISGVFFGGPPYQILKAWRDGEVQVVLSAEILDEYQRVGHTLGEQGDRGQIFDLDNSRKQLSGSVGRFGCRGELKGREVMGGSHTKLRVEDTPQITPPILFAPLEKKQGKRIFVHDRPSLAVRKHRLDQPRAPKLDEQECHSS
jgi:hypothetical protein